MLNLVASVMTTYILMVSLTIVVRSSLLSSLVMVIFTSFVMFFGQMGMAHAPFLVFVLMAYLVVMVNKVVAVLSFIIVIMMVHIFHIMVVISCILRFIVRPLGR